MSRKLLSFVLGVWVSSVAFAQARPPIPSVVLDHMNDLDRRCAAAGGRAGEGRFVVAQDFTGDGRLDYLLSEGDYNCVRRPGLFRQGGVGRVDIFVVDARNAARRVYSDQLIAYRVLAGKPAKVQIARQGTACGPGSNARTQCAVQLAWNGQGFGEAVAVSDARVPGDAAPAARSLPVATPAVDAAAGSGAPAPLAVPAEARPRFLAGVRWAAKPRSRELSASGRLGNLDVSVSGAPAAKTLGMNWMEVGAEPPYDIVGAMRVRGVTLTEIACEEFGAGEWQRVFSGSAPGRAPFRLELGQRTAPFANSNSYYGVTIDLSGRAPAPLASRPVCSNPSNLL